MKTPTTPVDPTLDSAMQRYSSASIAMHWLMVLAFVCIYVVVNLIDLYPEGSASQGFMKSLHISLGLLVFALVWLRLVFRIMGNTPPVIPAPPAWQQKLARLLHAALYLLMVAMPLLGWAARSASGEPVAFFGLALPALVGANEALGERILEIHETFGIVGYFLIGAHALAALFHHYVLKDNTLRRMTTD